jgi:hypothetical protein
MIRDAQLLEKLPGSYVTGTITVATKDHNTFSAMTRMIQHSIGLYLHDTDAAFYKDTNDY